MSVQNNRKTDDEIFKIIIQHEGTRFTNDPIDPGGATKYGITLRAWQEFSGKTATAETIEDLTLDQAKSFYLARHIHPLDRFADPLRLLLIDISILRGMRSCILMLQGAGLGVTADGVIGPVTMGATQALGFQTVTNLLVGAMMQHYAEQVKATPAKVKYLAGWRKRTLSYYQR